MRPIIALLVGVVLLLTIAVTAGTGKASAVSSNQAMNLLKEGNARYVKGELTYPHQDADYLTRTATAQYPIATVLSCSDSRVPVEQVFDLGIGDLFVVRVAGHVSGVNELASVEYGVNQLETPTLIVLGHTQCGAINGVVTGATASGSVAPIFEKIAPAVERAAKANPAKSGKELVPATTIENVWQTIESILAQSVVVRQRVVDGKLKVVGGIYHLSDGQVEWLGSHPKQSQLVVSAVANAASDQDEEFYAKAEYKTPSISGGKNASGASSESALNTLKEGNRRFAEASRTYPNQDWDRMKAAAFEGQRPYATVLTCADSRLPVENLFDAGIGDIYVVRVAGNVAGLLETGSVEYALQNLQTPILVVLGHSSCGAVTAVANKTELSGAVPELVDRIQPAVARVEADNPNLSGNELVAKAAEANIWQTISDLYAQSPEVCARVKAGKLSVVGAEYNIENGSIEWLGNHPEENSLVAATLAKCDGEAAEYTDATDNLPAVEQPKAVETTSVEQPKAEPTAPKQGNTLGAALDKLQQQVDALQQTQQAVTPAQPATASSAPTSAKPASAAVATDPSANFQQQLQQLQAELRRLAEQVQANRLADSTIAAILSDIEVLKAENSALRGMTEKASQQLASLDDDVIPTATNETYELQRFAGLVDELNKVVEKAKTPAKPAVNSPEVKRGSITIFGLLNQQYYQLSGDKDQSTFDNKRARLGFTGGLNNYAKITIHGEFAKAPKLLDGFVTLTPNKEWSFKFGQTQPAFGQNFLRSPAAYTLVTPSLAMALGTDRDIGAQIAWEHAFSKNFNLQLTAGVFNGSGINVSDSNSVKNSVVRAQMKLGSSLTLGVNNYAGKSNNTVNLKNVDTWGNFANWTWKSEEVEFEYIHSKVGGVKKDAWYLWGGHTMKTNWKFIPEIQLVARYEEYDANRAIDNNKVNRTTIGTTFYIDKKYTLIQLNYQLNGEEGATVRNNEFVANFQVGF